MEAEDEASRCKQALAVGKDLHSKACEELGSEIVRLETKLCQEQYTLEAEICQVILSYAFAHVLCQPGKIWCMIIMIQ